MTAPRLTILLLLTVAGTAVEPVAELRAMRLASDPVVDGDPSDAAWSAASEIPSLVPALEATPDAAGGAVHTRVRVGWTPSGLFVRMQASDADVIAGRAPADRLYLDDVAEVFVDGAGDGRHFWELQATPDNRSMALTHLIMSEPVYTEHGRLSQDFSQRERFLGMVRGDEGMQAAASRIEGGWIAEFRVAPAAVHKRSGRSDFRGNDVLRAQFVRYDRSAAIAIPEVPLRQATWTPVLTGCPHISAIRWGRVVLVEP